MWTGHKKVPLLVFTHFLTSRPQRLYQCLPKLPLLLQTCRRKVASSPSLPPYCSTPSASTRISPSGTRRCGVSTSPPKLFPMTIDLLCPSCTGPLTNGGSTAIWTTHLPPEPSSTSQPDETIRSRLHVIRDTLPGGILLPGAYTFHSFLHLFLSSPGTLHISRIYSGNVISISQPDFPCPGQSTAQFHTLNEADVTGCALGIVYNSDVKSIKPQDFTVFSVNQKCVWNLHTNFEVRVSGS